MPQSAVRSPQRKAFTLVEILSTVAIMAVLATLAMFFTANYVTWAKNTADKQTLSVLNDALTRYKCQGGDVNALTLGAPIGNIISRLKTPVDWAGQTHQFLQSGQTFLGKSLAVLGAGHQYRFTKYNTFQAEAGGTSPSSLDNPSSGLIAWWKLDEGSGTTTADSSGNNLTGTLTGSPTWTTGMSGTGALTFNGTTQYCTAGLTNVGNNATVSFWIKYTNYIHNGYILGNGNWNSDRNGLNVAMYGGKIYYELCSASAKQSINAPSAYNDGAWHLITITWNGTNVKLYDNGSNVQTTTQTIIPVTNVYNFSMGANPDGQNYRFNGTLDDVRVYNRALSASEVAQLYSQ